MILGLDISSTFTGYTILDEVGGIVECEAIDLRRTKGLFNKANVIKEVLITLKRYEITEVFVEEALMNFKFGSTSASTLSLLHRFNGVICYIVNEIFAIDPVLINATRARGIVGIAVKKGEKAKINAFKHLTKTVPVFTFKLTPKGNPKPGTYDRSDSWVIATAGFKLCQQGSN